MADRSLAQRDEEFWSARVRALAALAAADAVAVVLPLPDGRYVSFAAHNVGQDPAWLEGAAQYLVWSAVKQQTTQSRAETHIALADERMARSIVVAPIRWADRVIGAFVALRETAVYDTTVGASASELADLAGLELAVSNVLQRANERPDESEVRRARDDRRHAIALYELSRLALGGGPERTADVVADALDCGLVGIWLEEDGWLRLAEGHGYASEPRRVRIDTDDTLLRVMRDGTSQRVQRGSNGGAAWMGEATEVIAAPLAQGAARGMLVLGHPARPFTAADLTIAPTLAECVALARTHRALPAPATRAELPAPERPKVVEAPLPIPPTPAQPATTAATVDAPAPAPSGSRARLGWVLPLFALALLAIAVGAFLGEPLVFVLAALLLLVALWVWLA